MYLPGRRPVAKAGFDRDTFAIHVWRSVRAHGDTKTEKSCRTLELPLRAADALRRASRAPDLPAAQGGGGVVR